MRTFFNSKLVKPNAFVPDTDSILTTIQPRLKQTPYSSFP